MKSTMKYRVQLQLAEAFGPDNRWYCSKAHGYPVTDETTLLTYFIKNGGADDFSNRFDAAMGAENRWYCSEFYGREIQDEETLWGYFMEHANLHADSELSVAC